jgi:hypothetical protein
MKRTWMFLSLALLAMLVLSLAAAPAVSASHCSDDRRVLGGSYTLQSGEVLDRNLIVLGGNATLAQGSQVLCSVVVLGGNLSVAGTVVEDVVVFGGNASLASTAVIEGELITFGGSTQRAPGAEVRGGESEGFPIRRGPLPQWFPFQDRVPFLNPVLNFYRSVFQAIVWSVGMGLLALLVMLFWPDQTTRVSAAASAAPGASGGLGLLTAIAVPVLIVLTLVTICLAPIAFVGGLIYTAALVFGWIALGQVVGARLATALRLYDLSPAVSAALGTATLTLVMYIVAQIPCVGWVVPVVLAAVGLGAVTLTRFGTRAYYVPPPLAPPPAAPALAA